MLATVRNLQVSMSRMGDRRVLPSSQHRSWTQTSLPAESSRASIVRRSHRRVGDRRGCQLTQVHVASLAGPRSTSVSAVFPATKSRVRCEGALPRWSISLEEHHSDYLEPRLPRRSVLLGSKTM